MKFKVDLKCPAERKPNNRQVGSNQMVHFEQPLIMAAPSQSITMTCQFQSSQLLEFETTQKKKSDHNFWTECWLGYNLQLFIY